MKTYCRGSLNKNVSPSFKNFDFEKYLVWLKYIQIETLSFLILKFESFHLNACTAT